MSASGATRELWILRHAKAVQQSADDHGRTLTDRGRRQCAELAAHLGEDGAGRPVPPLVLVSSAERARQTAALVLDALGAPSRVEVDPGLYRAHAAEVLERVQLVDDDIPSVMVVGHNPTLEELAWVLLEDAPTGRGRLEGGLSTCALAVVAFDVASWGGLLPAAGRLLDLYAPSTR